MAQSSSALITCSDFGQPYCIMQISGLCSKLISSIFACALSLFCGMEIYLNLRNWKNFDTRLAIIVLMLLSLICTVNIIVGDLLHEILGNRVVLFLQLFFMNNFFLTVFYYVADNVLTGRVSRIALHIFYILMVLFFVSVLIVRNLLYLNDRCQRTLCTYSIELWYMIVNIVTILISILIFLLYCKKNRQ